jgi:cytochrome c-type biogenesis protein CcmE
MATKQKQRFIVAGGIVLIAILAMLAFFGAGTSPRVMTVAEAAAPGAVGQRVEVTGNVVNNSFDIEGGILTFSISDPDDPGVDLPVSYDRGVSATFGNGVTAICTGTIGDDGVLKCSELVTKCPSKYETATDALTVERLLGYGDQIVDKTVKVQGTVQPGTLKDATADARFSILDADGSKAGIPVKYQGALSDEVKDNATVVLLGSLGAGGTFTATEVALEG